MGRPPNVDPIRAALGNLGELIHGELKAAVLDAILASAPKARVAVVAKVARPKTSPKTAPTRVTGIAACKVPGCGRAKAAFGLCQTHYAKARRLKMDVEALAGPQLAELRRDGRATRWKK